MVPIRLAGLAMGENAFRECLTWEDTPDIPVEPRAGPCHAASPQPIDITPCLDSLTIDIP